MNKSKEAYLQYRERARELYARGEVIHGEQHGTNIVLEEVTVPQHAHVSICEDGAFVEAIVWVPASKFNRPEQS